MNSIGERPPGRLPKAGDKVHIKGCTPGFIYVVRPPGTVERGLNVWSVKVRPHNGVAEFWALLANVTVVKCADL